MMDLIGQSRIWRDMDIDGWKFNLGSERFGVEEIKVDILKL
jgi:hypothetical protein